MNRRSASRGKGPSFVVTTLTSGETNPLQLPTRGFVEMAKRTPAKKRRTINDETYLTAGQCRRQRVAFWRNKATATSDPRFCGNELEKAQCNQWSPRFARRPQLIDL
jgi:hypothetical protein